MADLFQGSALPNVNTSQTQQTTTPTWYTNYISNLANNAAQAQAGAQYVGPTALQQQSFADVTGAANAGTPALNAAVQSTQNTLGQINPYALGQNAQALFNPYINNQVAAIGQLGEQNVLQNIAPGTTAGAVGTGQFGSSRGAQALGQAINQAQQNTSALQAQALEGGYQNALAAAQNQNQQQLAAGAQLGALGQTQQQTGLAGINAINTLGTQQQQIGQNQQLFPLQTLANEAQILQGANIPTSVSSNYTGPIPGSYSLSPLQQIAGLGSILGATGGTTAVGNLYNNSAAQGFVNSLFAGTGPLSNSSLSKLFGTSSGTSTGTTPGTSTGSSGTSAGTSSGTSSTDTGSVQTDTSSPTGYSDANGVPVYQDGSTYP